MKKVFLFLTMFLFAFTGVTRANVQQNRAGQVIEQGFEDGLGDWTLNHCHSSSGVSSAYTAHGGSKVFRFYYTTNYPQYLISPEFDEENGGGNITFYVARYSGNYPETYKVGYSFTTNDPSEFTWNDEVTCTTLYSTGYDEVSYDLPAGVKYVAIACTSNDQFYMFVDDITVTLEEPAPAPTPGELVEVTIGDPTSTTTNSYLPGYTLYDYSISQQIYTADEIGVAGTINTLTMWLKNSSSYARNINVYMKEVEATAFASTSAWESFTASDMVASFTMPNGISTPIEVALDLSTPFEYSGSGSLAICFQDVTGSWSSGLGGVVMDATGNQALYAYRDGTVYDPSNPGVNGTLLAKKNVIRLSIMTSGGGATTAFSTIPEVLDLGYRPNGAWMAPYTFAIKSNIGATTINALDFSGNYFTYNAELPAEVSANTPLDVVLTTGTAEEGLVESTMTIMYSGNRDIEQHPVTAYAYDPAEGDVYENAIEVTSFPYNNNAPAGIYKNYALPTETEGADAVYKMTFANDVMLTAGTTGADGVATLYAEDFEGEGGPMEDNYYTYNGPTINPGPVSMWFSYSYTGSNTWYGTSAGGGFYFGYKISADFIAANGLAGLTITTVEAAAREAYPYHCFIIEGGADPFEGNMIGGGTIENPTALYFFDINLNMPAYISGDSDIWVIFYSDSPYAAYCGRYPVNTANGKIWTYNPNATTPQWTSNTTYTPVIYCHMLELPTGRTATMDLAKMEVKKGNGVVSEVAEAEGNVMNVAKAQIANNNNRDVIGNNIEDLYVKAGTYYLVAASTEAEFPVSIEVADVPAPEQAVVVAPYDGETNVTTPYLAEWVLGDYTEEMQVLVGTQYPPQTALIDWTDYLVESAFLLDLEPNQSYFMQVNERNAAGTTYGEIVAFVTPIDPVQNFAAEETELYPGDAAVFTWDANRTFQGYNLYMYDGIAITKVNDEVITTNTYTVEDLAYNMDGYQFAVTAVYDAGESVYSDVVYVFMTGLGTVNGHVYDTDTLNPIAFATIEFRGTDEYGEDQVILTMADEEGAYECEVLAGNFTPYIAMEGYAELAGPALTVAYEGVYDDVDIFTHEFYYPLEQIIATEEENDVLVEWSWTPAELIVDFETGDFSQADFTLPATYPWAITTGHSHEGTYAMKSTCEGIASGLSEVEVTVDVPYDGKMGFWVAVSSEANYDKFHFYIDGVEKGAAISGVAAYAYKEFDVTEGTHTYKWAYQKDSSVNSNDDCAYVDDITLYRYVAPLPPVVGATTYDFEDSSMMGWTSIDGDGDGNGWVSSANPGIYHNSGVSLSGTGHDASEAYVISGSYANQTGQALTPNNFLVSPAAISAENGAQIQFYACAQDANYAAEHFGVAVSTTNNTSASAFTTVQEWTLTAKSAPAAEEYSAVRGTRAQGTWYLYTVDLSAYAGQDIYVAIRHFNCTDQFILNVDDITLATGGSKPMRSDRSLANYILYRGNLYDSTVVVVNDNIPSDVMSYVEEGWEDLPFGIYEWGIQAKYEGYAPTPDATRSEVINEGFESGSMPEGWTQEGNGTWSVGTGDYSSTTGAATGSYNAKITHSTTGNATYLITPAMDLSGATEGTISCNYINRSWAGDTDGFGIYYRVNGGAWNELFSTTSSHSTWTSTGDIALTGFAANYQIGFKHVDNYGYGVGLDDVVVTTSGSAPGPQPTPADGLSEILWSNQIEKDMNATLTFNITLDNGEDVAGATIAIVGEENTYNVTVADATTEVIVRKAPAYEITVTKAGYTQWTQSGAIEADAEYDIELVELIVPVANLYVSPTGWVMWEGNGGTPGPGPQPGPGSNSFTEGFEGGLNGWNVLNVNAAGGEWLHSDDNLGGYDYTELAHGGTGFAMCYSYVDYVGAFNTDSYMYTPQKYAIENGSTLTFWADNANDQYPENFSVCVATADNPTAADFTQVWSGGAKGTANGNATVRHQNNRYENWRSHTIDLSAYAGQEVYIAFHDVNYDAYEIWIDDVELSAGNKGDRTALLYKVMIDGKYEGETVNPFFQHNVEGFEEGSTHVTAIRPIYLGGMGDWAEYTWKYTSCNNFDGVTNLAAAAQDGDVKLTWTLPAGGTPNPNPNPNPGAGWTEGFESGMPAGWNVIDANNDGWTWCLTSAIPSTWTYYASMTLDWYRTGTNAICSGSYINGVGALTPDEYLVMGQQTLGAGSSIKFYAAATDASYPADHFGIFVSDNGTSNWTMVNEWTLTSKDGAMAGGRESRDGNGAKLGTWHEYTADLSAFSGQKYVALRHFNCNDQYIMCVDDIEFTAASKGNDRAMWDLVGSFTGTSAGQQAVATDGNYIYTASWQSAPTGGHTFYQYTMDGTFVEGFEIAGATGIRDLTTDGEYFYGTSGGAQIFILDFTTRTLVGTINCSGLTSRHISYDPERDGFWSGNWSTLALYSRTGSLIQNGPAPSSAYGSAYYKDADNVEHLYLFCQPNSDCKVYDYNITTGTLGTSVVLDYTATAPGCTGIAGGSFIGAYNGMTCWFGNSQQDPNLIAIYELDGSAPTPPTPPTPTGNVLGVNVYRDGEFLTMAAANAPYVDENLAEGTYEYCIEVVYDDYGMSCPQCITVEVGAASCDPVTNLTAVLHTQNGSTGCLLSWDAPAGAVSYNLYQVEDGQVYTIAEGWTATSVFLSGFEEAGIYTFGVTAVYANCESEMETVDFEWLSVDENEIVSAIYPNPTSGDLHINATAMTQISVYNAMGQMVYNQAVNADEMVINMGQFEAGVYMVRIDTENGSSVKRITVVK